MDSQQRKASRRRISRTWYALRPCDRRLVDAAIGLGFWLLDQPEITDAGRAAIEHLQAALRRLPEDTPSLCADYGFVAWPTQRAEFRTVGDYPWDGIARTWGVSMNRGALEIGSTFNTHASAAPWDEDEHELWFHVDAGGRPYSGTWNVDRWIREVAALERWRGGIGVTIELEASCSWWGSTGERDLSRELEWKAQVPQPNIAAWAKRPWGPDVEQLAHDRRYFSGMEGEYDSVSKVLGPEGLPLATSKVATPSRVAAPFTFVEDPEAIHPRFLNIRRPLDLDFQPLEAEEFGLDGWGAAVVSAEMALRANRYDGLTFLEGTEAGAPRRLWVPLEATQILAGDIEEAAVRLNGNVAPENWARLIRLYERKTSPDRRIPTNPKRQGERSAGLLQKRAPIVSRKLH